MEVQSLLYFVLKYLFDFEKSCNDNAHSCWAVGGGKKRVVTHEGFAHTVSSREQPETQSNHQSLDVRWLDRK